METGFLQKEYTPPLMQGIEGPVGPKGEQGVEGPVGPKGDQGVEGPVGPKGDKGDKGEKGPKGDRGEKGLAGEVGPAGPKGDRGEKGDKGEKGPKGDRGKDGDNGSPDTGADIVKKISTLKGEERLSYKVLKDVPDIFGRKQASKDASFLELTDTPKSYSGQSGKVATVNEEETGFIFTEVSSGGITWNNVSGTTQAAVVNNGYIANNAALVTITLPAIAIVGSVVEVTGYGEGGWRISQNDGQTIHFGAVDTTTGTGGYLEATNRYDSIGLLCVTENTDWVILRSIGNIAYV